MSQFQDAQNTYRFPDTVRGTTLKAQAFEITVNDAPPASNLASVTCVFAKDGATTLTLTCSITSAANWQFTTAQTSAATMLIEEGTHVGDIKTTDAAGVVRKYCRTEIKILPSPQS